MARPLRRSLARALSGLGVTQTHQRASLALAPIAAPMTGDGPPVTASEARPDDDRQWRHELDRQDHQRDLDHARRVHDRVDEFSRESNKAAVENASLVFRTAVLINGGAAVSVLAFAGGLISQGKLGLGPQVADVSLSLLLFALGVLAGVLGIGFAYFTNYCITGDAQSRARQWEPPYVVETAESRRWRRAAISSFVLASACGFGAAVLFVCGVIEVRNAITRPVAHTISDGS
jgi:hypothetical protein